MMRKFLNSLGLILRSESGAAAIEYGLLIGLISTCIITSLLALSLEMDGNFNTIATSLDNATSSYQWPSGEDSGEDFGEDEDFGGTDGQGSGSAAGTHASDSGGSGLSSTGDSSPKVSSGGNRGRSPTGGGHREESNSGTGGDPAGGAGNRLGSSGKGDGTGGGPATRGSSVRGLAGDPVGGASEATAGADRASGGGRTIAPGTNSSRHGGFKRKPVSTPKGVAAKGPLPISEDQPDPGVRSGAAKDSYGWALWIAAALAAFLSAVYLQRIMAENVKNRQIAEGRARALSRDLDGPGGTKEQATMGPAK
jgi:Flp pilus assembly pilin Flp